MPGWKQIVREKRGERSARLEVTLAPNLKIADEVYLSASGERLPSVSVVKRV